MFDLGSVSTLYSFLFDVTIYLSSLFVWGSLGLELMTFSTHCISCTRGMGIISLGSLSLVSFHFFHLITLAYVTSCVWRPPWGHDFTLRLTAHIWAILELGWRLSLVAWWMRSYDMIYTRSYPSYQWWIFGGDMIYIGAYPVHRWQFLSGMTLHWGITIPESAFIGDTVTPLNILHWDTLHSLMIDFWDDGSFWDIVASRIAHVET